MKVFVSLMGILLAASVGISFKGAQSESTLFVTVSMFGLPLSIAICCGFFICAPGHILGLFYIMVHHGLSMY